MDKQRLLTDYLVEKNIQSTLNHRRKSKVKKLLIAVIILAAAGYGLLSYHFILFDGSMKIIKKTGISYENTFVDARGSKKLELAMKPDLIAAGINDVIGDVTKSLEKQTN